MTYSKNALTIVLTIIVIGLVATIICLCVMPQPGKKFTEFYLLNQRGKATEYPDEVIVGQPASVIAGVINHEGKPVTYTIQIMSGGAIIKSVHTDILQDKQKWENRIDLSLDTLGDRQRVEFYLYIDNEAVPHIKDPLVLMIDVVNPK